MIDCTANSTLVRRLEAALADRDWIAVGALGDDLKQLSRSCVAKANATKTLAKAREDYIAASGVDIVRFHALSLVCASFLGGHRKMSAARELAFFILRPDLFVQAGIFPSTDELPPRFRYLLRPNEQRRLGNERELRLKRLKGYIEKPASCLEPVLLNVSARWAEAIG